MLNKGMDSIYLPFIAAADFEAFRAFMKHHLPDTYSEWEQRHQQQITDCYRQALGHTEVAITPAEFAAHCQANGHEPKATVLRRFAREKATKKR